MIKTKPLYVNIEMIEDVRHLFGIDVYQEIIEAEIISILDGKKLISIEEDQKIQVIPNTFAPQLIWDINYDEDIEETVEENIEEIRRQRVMNSL